MRHLIVGTAGHIDHGKSTLVHALTGIDPDRLKEEKERGITIDLGFADLDLGRGRILSFVDVPGHERFVRHMVAGATGVDAVLLIVAADEGVRPQTREHLAICSLLEIGSGIVVLTKADLVDPEILEVVELEVREFTRGSFLEEAPLVAVSARTGNGVAALLDALGSLFERIPERAGGGIARLPIDRSFVLHGFGTVVTGTLISGALREGEEVEVLPGKRRARVRGLQVHRERVPSAQAGQRTAVNLQGIDRDEAPRGATLAAVGTLPTTRRIWARVRLLPGAPASLRKGGGVRFHQGTCERAARLRVLGEGDSGELVAEILLREETVLLPRDRFILRRPAPMDTVGGGIVVDVRPPTGRAHARGAAFAAGDPDTDLLARLERAGRTGRDAKEVASELGFSGAELESRAESLVEAGRVVRAGGRLLHAEVWSGLEQECIAQLCRFHQQDPLRRGMSREELRSRLCPAMPQEVWRDFLEKLAATARIRLEGDLLAEASHDVKLSDRDLEVSEAIERRLREAGLDPPDAAQALSSDLGDRAERIVDLLIARGRLVRLRDGRLLHADPLEALREKLREHAQVSRMIDVATFKRIAEVTRKNAIPLLEYLDGARITRRVGDLREILVS